MGRGMLASVRLSGLFYRKSFLYLHQYITSLSGCLGFYAKKDFILHYFYVLYLSQEWYEESLSDCLGFYEEKVIILLYFYMLYLSQEWYELYKRYIIKKSFCAKSRTIRQCINCKRKIYKFKKSFHQKSQTFGQSIVVKEIYN